MLSSPHNPVNRIKSGLETLEEQKRRLRQERRAAARNRRREQAEKDIQNGNKSTWESGILTLSVTGNTNKVSSMKSFRWRTLSGPVDLSLKTWGSLNSHDTHPSSNPRLTYNMHIRHTAHTPTQLKKCAQYLHGKNVTHTTP